MLTSGYPTSKTSPGPTEREEEQSHPTPGGDPNRRLRWLAVLLGLFGTAMGVAVPFLPVVNDIVTLHWPTQQGTRPVNAPLVSYQPVWLHANVPCTAMRDLNERSSGSAVLVDTTPPESTYGKMTGMSLQVQRGELVVTNRGQQVATAKVPAGDCMVTLSSDAHRTTVTLAGKPLVDLRADARPQVTGIFSDLDAGRDNVKGLSVDIRTDTRFQTSATVLKDVVMVLAFVGLAGCVWILHRLDVRAGRRAPRLAPKGWWKPTGRDIAVYAVLITWTLIGAITSDDGYILTMARARAASGYVGNYYRWFSAPEAPFGWFYELYSAWVQVSTATPWVRLPALLMGIGSWLLISRETLPRLGKEVRRSRAAGWAAAAVFLCFWLPFNNGLRPEPVVALCALLAMCAVERAVAARRLVPLALGLFAATLAIAATPTGVIAVLPFLAAARPVTKLLRERIRPFGWAAVLLPLAASATAVLAIVFQDQTLVAELQAKRIETQIGPAEQWYEEFDRYQALFSGTADGSLARRFPVLLVILCLAICLVVLLRRRRIRGAALGPSSRLIGITMMSFVVLALTPTKWTHHFGAFAALGSSLAALTALASSATVLRSKRNRALVVAGLMIILALAFRGPNAWWYVSAWGVPWYDKPPSVGGHQFSTIILIAAGIALLIAGIEHLRIPDHGVVEHPPETRGRALLLGSAPLAIVCALLVLFEVLSFVKVLQKQSHTYSLGADNITRLTQDTCGLSDHVLVEADPLRDVLKPAANQAPKPVPTTPPPNQPPNPTGTTPSPEEALQPAMTGFRRGRDGLPPGNGQDPAQPDWTPPYRLGDDNAPVWGTYAPGAPLTGELRTPWYTLPDSARTGQAPIVIALAGMEAGPNAVFLEFGKNTPKGFQVIDRHQIIKGPANVWREASVTLSGPDAQADQVRIVAEANALGVENWMAVSAPRVPTFVRMTDVIFGRPVFLEWPVGLAHPCARPFNTLNGVAEMPAYRITGDADFRRQGQGWSAPDAGGPFGWLNVDATVRKLPAFLDGQIDRDWGTLYAIDPYEPNALPASAAERVTHEVHSGLWSPGPMPNVIYLPGNAPKSDNRTNVPSGANPGSNP
ncbi:arabinosyltransferase domain-containing protein [Gandjariella thermophila]|uniref:Arabinosyltransferase n=1 Tax=Gandjariella thermophila TaxID=1931992 RepID=A0A4D4IZI1_9PSEU|nr:arabinosyltransferase domain-containing protein [Gandjariella thermophila]GDY29661.1 arabinosyltransferase [Gandjariella thermophila]